MKDAETTRPCGTGTELAADPRRALRVDPALRQEVEALYADYAAVLDDGPLEGWPALFTEDCDYRVIPRENWDLDLPIALIRCESRGMLRDRVFAVEDTATFGPRHHRHMVSALRVLAVETDAATGRPTALEIGANLVVAQVQPDHLPTVFAMGRYRDRLVPDPEGEGWLFARKLVILDSDLVQNSLVYPL